MKVSPLAAGAAPSINPNEGQSAGPERVARAKAAAAGRTITQEERGPAPDPQVERAQNTIKKIKMRTNRSPDRHLRLEEEPVEAPVAAAPAEDPIATSDITEPTEPTEVVSEDTKPLSPQFAALAKGKRALELAQKEFAAQKAAFEAGKPNLTTDFVSKADIKSNALKVLLENGVTYDQLTEQILAQNQGLDSDTLDARLKALEEGIDKKLESREAQTQERAEEAALTDMLGQAEALADQGDAYELIKEAKAFDRVLRRIYKTYKTTGKLLDVKESMDFVENQLLQESLKWVNLKKVQSHLNPAPQAKAPVQTDRPGTKIMRTLTNRDGSSSVSMSKRERAIAAMEGRLK